MIRERGERERRRRRSRGGVSPPAIYFPRGAFSQLRDDNLSRSVNESYRGPAELRASERLDIERRDGEKERGDESPSLGTHTHAHTTRTSSEPVQQLCGRSIIVR